MIKTRNLTLAFALAVTGMKVAYETKAGWKKDAEGKLVVDADGNPIYIDTAGAEKSLAADTVSRLNGEAKTLRERAEAAEKTVQAYGDFKPEQIKAATEALATVQNLKDGDLIKAGEAERVRNEMKAGFETQINELTQQNAGLLDKHSGLLRDLAFKGSKWIGDNIAIPVDMLASTFGKNFKVENDQIVAYNNDGTRMTSKKRGGEYADFDEAMSQLVEAYPHKDMILKSSGNSGSGGGGNGGNGNADKRIVRRADFNALSPAEQAATAQKANKGELVIRD